MKKRDTASFDVDAQNTFTPVCPNELPVPDGNNIVDELNKQAHYARLRVGSKDAHSNQALWVADEKNPQFSKIEGHDNLDIRWKRHGEVGSEGFELISGLPKVTEYDFFVYKGLERDCHPYGACYHDFAEKLSTGVIEYLKYNGIKNVIVGGLATDYCVKFTVLQLCKANFKVIINLAACRGIADETIQEAMKEIAKASAMMVQNSRELSSFIDK
jgi:nicotinamidase/pyrazinamidase